MTRYEYATTLVQVKKSLLSKKIFMPELQRLLAEWGRNGWELVTIQPVGWDAYGDPSAEQYAIFKRALPE